MLPLLLGASGPGGDGGTPEAPYVLPVVRRENWSVSRRITAARRDYDPWRGMRVVFLQYASDPIVSYRPAAVLRLLVWMREPPSPDVSPEVAFMPVVTQFQLALDMALATTAPAGPGHACYAHDDIAPWAAVANPEAWIETDSARLAAHCDNEVAM